MIPILASVRSENFCFHSRAISTFLVVLSISISLFPSGCPATFKSVNPNLSNSPVSSNCIDDSKLPFGVSTPPASRRACRTSASELYRSIHSVRVDLSFIILAGKCGITLKPSFLSLTAVFTMSSIEVPSMWAM